MEIVKDDSEEDLDVALLSGARTEDSRPTRRGYLGYLVCGRKLHGSVNSVSEIASN